MADSGRQSPLGVNVLGSVLQNTGLTINPVAASYMGSSKTNSSYTFGKLVSGTSLRMLTWAINDGYNRGTPGGGNTLTNATYNNLLSIGTGVCEALGNAKPSTYIPVDPAGVWARTSTTSSTACTAEQYGIQKGIAGSLPGPATSGYGITSASGQGQQATWYPYDSTNPNNSVTQWGWTRCHALQAWNEFNWNGTAADQATPEYKEFLGSFMSAQGFISNSNKSINVIDNSNQFLDGTYSNMNDLISADIAGVSLSSLDFGTDLENLGKVIDLQRIDRFGMPSNLLMSIGKAGAMTPDLSLALISAGLTKEEISAIVSGILPNWTVQLEQKIFGAFLIIAGENLAQILAPLQCKTSGLTTLADLLNVRMMFPISYASLTVPVYNGSLGLPTNSKTYYLIYQSGAVNPALNSDTIKNYVGTLIPKGLPPKASGTSTPENFTELPKGFGSYLDGILPSDWATAAGALSYSIRQIKNIENAKFSVLAQVAKGIENTTNLPLVSGTSKPTNQTATTDSQRICSLGSGDVGTYTFSDMFGCMSGLPYPWERIYSRLTEVQTATLANIYQQMFLAVTWEQATVSVQYTTYTGPGPSFLTYYHVTGLTITDPGGGYGRGAAPAPTITISNGGAGTTTIGTNDKQAGSNGAGTYGRLTTVTLASAGTDTTTVPTATVQAPPTSNVGGTNTAAGTVGWPATMNSVVQNYIDQSNTEIGKIKTAKPNQVKFLNEYWNILGSQLVREQRTRYTGIAPVPVPKDFFMNPYPTTSYTFLDSMPVLAQDTRPHMSAQTIEAITDMNSVGGQSVVAKMREERNQARLQKLGIDPDNNITDTMSPITARTLTANGTTPTARPGAGIKNPYGKDYTLPAWPGNTRNNVAVSVSPAGYYLPAEVARLSSPTRSGSLAPGRPGTSPVPGYNSPLLPGFQPTSSTAPGDITPILDGQANPVVSSVVPTGPVNVPESLIDDIVIIAPPNEYNLDNLPANLDPNYTDSTMFPASLSISDAIDHVVACNCDCWVE